MPDMQSLLFPSLVDCHICALIAFPVTSLLIILRTKFYVTSDVPVFVFNWIGFHQAMEGPLQTQVLFIKVKSEIYDVFTSCLHTHTVPRIFVIKTCCHTCYNEMNPLPDHVYFDHVERKKYIFTRRMR